MPFRRVAALAAGFAALLVGPLAGQASALAPGVFIDPGSPAGKEYSFPLAVLRGAGAGHGTGSQLQPPLFGVGITAAGPTAGSGATINPSAGSHRPAERAGLSTSRSGRSVNSSSAATHGASGRAQVVPPTRQQILSLTSLVRQGSGTPQVALLAAPVLLGGLLLGLALQLTLRRRSGAR